MVSQSRTTTCATRINLRYAQTPLAYRILVCINVVLVPYCYSFKSIYNNIPWCVWMCVVAVNAYFSMGNAVNKHYCLIYVSVVELLQFIYITFTKHKAEESRYQCTFSNNYNIEWKLLTIWYGYLARNSSIKNLTRRWLKENILSIVLDLNILLVLHFRNLNSPMVLLLIAYKIEHLSNASFNDILYAHNVDLVAALMGVIEIFSHLI